MINSPRPYAGPTPVSVILVTSIAPGMVTQITFSDRFPEFSSRTHSGGDTDEAILCSRRADGAQFVRVCRQFVFVRDRRTPDPHRGGTALQLPVLRLGFALATL